MFSLNNLMYLLNFIPYGEEIKASIRGPYFYNDQVYRDEEDYNNIDLEKGLGYDNSTFPQVVSYH